MGTGGGGRTALTGCLGWRLRRMAEAVEAQEEPDAASSVPMIAIATSLRRIGTIWTPRSVARHCAWMASAGQAFPSILAPPFPSAMPILLPGSTRKRYKPLGWNGAERKSFGLFFVQSGH